MIRKGLMAIAVIAVGSVFFGGCASVRMESADRYNIPTDKERYLELSQFNKVYALTESSGWDATTSAVVFDFDDKVSVLPKQKKESKTETWVEIKSDEHLQDIINTIYGSSFRAITYKPCEKCDRAAAAAIFVKAEENIVVNYDKKEETLYFRKGFASPTGVGAGGAGGG